MDELVWSMEVGDGEDDVNDTLPPQTHKKSAIRGKEVIKKERVMMENT